MDVSRFVVLYSVLFSYLCEINYIIYKNKDKLKFKYFNLTYSTKTFAFEVVLFGIINLLIIFNLTGNISFNFYNLFLFINFYLSWFVGSFAGHQFHPAFSKNNYLVIIWKYIKSYIIIFALTIFSAFINRFELREITIIIYSIVAYSIMSFIGISFYYYIRRYRMISLNISGIHTKGEFSDIILSEKSSNNKNHYRSSFNRNDSELLNNKLKNLSLRKYPDIFEFLNKNIDLNTFDISDSLILKSDNVSNIDFLPNNSLQLILNLQKINQVKNINDYLAEVNQKLMKNGLFVGNFETAYLRHQSYLKNFPYYFAQIFYFFDFLWNRIFAKLFILNNIYSALMNGTNKALSLAEGLGMLYFNGFEVLHLKIIGNNMFFISKKVKEPIIDVSPSSGLIFKMKRIGKGGNPIYVYKLRTMHPYAEYLQDYVLSLNGYSTIGKPADDFRITTLGKIFKKILAR